MNSETIELTGINDNSIKLTGKITAANELKAKINIPVDQKPPVTVELEVTPTTQEQIFIPEENTYYDKVTCEAIPSEYIIPSGTINIGTSGTYDVTNYASANVDTQGSSLDWTQLGYNSEPQTIIDGYNYAKEIKNNWVDNINDGYQLYKNDQKLIYFPSIQTFNMKRMACFFENCYSLQKVGNFNTINMDSLGTAFKNCSSLREVFDINSNTGSGNFSIDNLFHSCISLETAPNITSKRRTNVMQAFFNCTSLKNVPEFNLGTVSGQGISNMMNAFSNCPNLTNESLNNIMGTIKKASYYGGTKTLYYIGLSNTQATTCTTLSNWADLVSKGWTTGY